MTFTYAVRRRIKDAVIQCRVKRFTREESLAFIKASTGHDISMRHLDTMIKNLKMSAPKQLIDLQESRFLFLDEVFKSRDEIEQYIREAWRLYHTSEGDKYLQLNCLKELHQLTVSRSNIIDVLPHHAAGVEAKVVDERRQQQKALPSHLLEIPSENPRRGQAIF